MNRHKLRPDPSKSDIFGGLFRLPEGWLSAMPMIHRPGRGGRVEANRGDVGPHGDDEGDDGAQSAVFDVERGDPPNPLVGGAAFVQDVVDG